MEERVTETRVLVIGGGIIGLELRTLLGACSGAMSITGRDQICFTKKLNCGIISGWFSIQEVTKCIRKKSWE